jgi:AcrR family transcriptional regulator
MTQAQGVSRPGGRTGRTRSAVHAAVRELLAAHDGATPTMAEVAAASGVHLATIYRRWRTPRALILDVAVDDLNRRAPVTVTGDLRLDLLTYARGLAAGVATSKDLGFLRTLISAAADPDLGTADIQALVTRRTDRFQEILDAGGATELTPIDLLDNLLAPVYLRALLSEPMSPDGPEPVRLVDNLLAIRDARRSAG